MYLIHFFFFFQAEDGIRDYKVTGVQTCALPISSPERWRRGPRRYRRSRWRRRRRGAAAPSFLLLAGGGARVLGAFQRRALHLARVHGRERGVVELPRANADHPLDGLHENLAVAHFARAGRREDGFDARLDEGLGAHHLDLHLLVELHDDGGAAVLPEDLLLAAVAAHAAERDAG